MLFLIWLLSFFSKNVLKLIWYLSSTSQTSNPKSVLLKSKKFNDILFIYLFNVFVSFFISYFSVSLIFSFSVLNLALYFFFHFSVYISYYFLSVTSNHFFFSFIWYCRFFLYTLNNCSFMYTSALRLKFSLMFTITKIDVIYCFVHVFISVFNVLHLSYIL